MSYPHGRVYLALAIEVPIRTLIKDMDASYCCTVLWIEKQVPDHSLIPPMSNVAKSIGRSRVG